MPAFAILLGLVIAGCWLAWRVAKASPLAGMLLGMPRPSGPASASPRVGEEAFRA